jgi:Protein of unknown function (DUF3168)
MTSAQDAVQHAALIALGAHPVLRDLLTGLYDGPPPRAPYPYLTIGDGVMSDWSTKTQTGREIQLMVTIWDDGEDAARLHALVAAVPDALAALPRDVSGWRIASLAFLRSRVVRDPAGPWAGLIDHRVRMLET